MMWKTMLAIAVCWAIASCGQDDGNKRATRETEGESAKLTAAQIAEVEAASECAVCLARGGTWQEHMCTVDCAAQDIGCYVDACPLPCSKDNCGDCFGKSSCEAQGCQWHQAEEALWCTTPWPT